MADAHALLFATPALAQMSELDRSILGKSFCERVLGPRKTLYRSGEAPPGLWFLASGFVKLTRTSACGKELLMSLAGPGEMFGPCCDPLRSSPASCTAVTQSPVRGLHMSSAAWKALSSAEPRVIAPVLDLLLSSRRGCTELGPRLAFHPVEARLAMLLHSLTRWSRGTARPVEVPKLLTHAEMATALGTAREVVTRCLARFEEQGLIERRGRRILVPDPAALAGEDA